MALVNPNIALSYKPAEIPQQRNMLTQAAQALEIRNAVRKNEATDALNAAYAQAYNPTTGTVDMNRLTQTLSSGPAAYNIPAVLKAERESQAARVKLDADTFKLQNDRIDRFAQHVNSFGNAQDALADIQAASHAGRIDKNTADTYTRQLQAANTPEAFAAWKNTTLLNTLDAKAQLERHFFGQDTGAGGQQMSVPKYGAGPATAVPGSQYKKVMSPYEAARIGQENQRLAQDATGVVYQEDANGNIVALPSKLKKGEVPTARVAVAPGGGFQPLTAKPSEAVGKEQMSINQQKAIVKGAIDAVTSAPDAFGWTTGNMPEAIRARTATPEENQARSYLFNVVSGVIKERAGTAQSAAEAETLRRFLPVETDNADIIKDKMTAFDKYLSAKESGTTKKRATPEAPKTSVTPNIDALLQKYR